MRGSIGGKLGKIKIKSDNHTANNGTLRQSVNVSTV